MTNRFFVKLRNLSTGKKFTLFYNVEKHSVANLWKQSMVSNYLTTTPTPPLNKEFCFHGWVKDWNQNSYSRNISVLCDHLNYAVDIINSNLSGYPKIDLHFSQDVLQSSEYRDVMNRIHHHFELLSGQTWAPSEWVRGASDKVKWAIKELNDKCHEIEGAKNSIDNPTGSAIFLNYNKADIQRVELTDEDYKCWQPICREWGMITTYYSQLGKTHKEAYQDNDEHIDKENISAPRYMVGASICQFRDIAPHSNISDNDPKYTQWLNDNDYDPTDPKLANGICVLARVDTDSYTMSWKEIDEIVKSMDDVYEVGFENEISQTYNNTWQQDRQAMLNSF